MNILFIVNKCKVFQVDSGGANRNNMFVKALSEIGHVDVISFQEDIKSNIDNCDVVYSEKIDDSHLYVDSVKFWICMALSPKNPYSYYKKDRRKELVIDSFMKKKDYDIIVCRYVDMVVKCGLLKYKDKLVVDVDDNPASVLRYQAGIVKKRLVRWKKRYESKRVAFMVEYLLSDVYCSFYSNQFEQPSPRSVLLHNSIVVTKPIPAVTDANSHRILYVGCLDFYPSKQGICYFVEKIFPMIRTQIPDVELWIVGKGNPELLGWLNEIKGVKALGRVEDLAAEYQSANVVAIPIYYGSGTCVKFVEALFMNRPIVSTPVGARGFEGICKDEVHYMLANDDEAFVTKTIALLSSAERSRKMAHDAYIIASQNYSQEKFSEIMRGEILRNSNH